MQKKITGTKLRKKLIKECDALVAQIVKIRHPYCVICKFRGESKSPAMEAGHLVSRRYYSLRWDLDNVFTQCQYHNSLHRFDTHPFDEWYVDTFGLGKWHDLYDKKQQTKSWKVWELTELKDDLQAQLGDLTTVK